MDGFDEEAFKKFFPESFGKQEAKTDLSTQFERSKRAAVKAKLEDEEASATRSQPLVTDGDGERGNKKADRDNDSDDDDNSSDDDEDEDEYPVSHELIFKTHERAVTTLSVDLPGSRFVSSSADCTIKFHNFASMTPSTLRAFKSVDPSAKRNAAAQETFSSLYRIQPYIALSDAHDPHYTTA